MSARQRSIADMTLRWARLRCPALATRNAGPAMFAARRIGSDPMLSVRADIKVGWAY